MDNIIAEMRTQNNAWHREDRGVIVNRDGSVYKYDLSKNNRSGSFSKFQRLRRAHFVGIIRRRILNNLKNFITDLSGKTARLHHKAYDAGSVKYIIYDNYGNDWLIAQTGNYEGYVRGSNRIVNILNNIDRYYIPTRHNNNYIDRYNENNNNYIDRYNENNNNDYDNNYYNNTEYISISETDTNEHYGNNIDGYYDYYDNYDDNCSDMYMFILIVLSIIFVMYYLNKSKKY
jgi:hypothetical protein